MKIETYEKALMLAREYYPFSPQDEVHIFDDPHKMERSLKFIAELPDERSMITVSIRLDSPALR